MSGHQDNSKMIVVASQAERLARLFDYANGWRVSDLSTDATASSCIFLFAPSPITERLLM